MKWGSDNIGKIMWGSSEMGKVYFGSDLVYQKSQPNPYRVIEGINFDGNVYYKIPGFHLQGSDTLKFSFNVTGNCNIIGCYTSSSAQDNYSLYVSTGSTSKYLRYNGGTYNSRTYTGRKVDVTITPTGSSGLRSNSTWSSKTFTSSADFCIGTTSDNSAVTSSYLIGTMYGNVEVVGRETFVPVVRIADSAIGYLGSVSWTFYANQGSGAPTEYTS
jgi:hypothetical protein